MQERSQADHENDQAQRYISSAYKLLLRDQENSSKEYGQKVRATFHVADFFVDLTEGSNIDEQVNRFIRLLFGYQFHTPTRDEYGMALARSASLCSSEMGRQVGAALATEEGEIVALGTNDVPRFAGGQYWEGDKPDHRDFVEGSDSNTTRKQRVIREALSMLREKKRLSDVSTDGEFQKLVRSVLRW